MNSNEIQINIHGSQIRDYYIDPFTQTPVVRLKNGRDYVLTISGVSQDQLQQVSKDQWLEIGRKINTILLERGVFNKNNPTTDQQLDLTDYKINSQGVVLPGQQLRAHNTSGQVDTTALFQEITSLFSAVRVPTPQPTATPTPTIPQQPQQVQQPQQAPQSSEPDPKDLPELSALTEAQKTALLTQCAAAATVAAQQRYVSWDQKVGAAVSDATQQQVITALASQIPNQNQCKAAAAAYLVHYAFWKLFIPQLGQDIQKAVRSQANWKKMDPAQLRNQLMPLLSSQYDHLALASNPSQRALHKKITACAKEANMAHRIDNEIAALKQNSSWSLPLPNWKIPSRLSAGWNFAKGLGQAFRDGLTHIRGS